MAGIGGDAFDFKLSNQAVAIVGGVAIIGIAAHVLSSIFRPAERQVKEHAMSVAYATEPVNVYHKIYQECADSATHPDSVHRNADRVTNAIMQREPHIRSLMDKAHKGVIDHTRVAEGIQNIADDVLDDLGIAKHPHSAVMASKYHTHLKNKRKYNLARTFANVHPGGLLLAPYERRWLDHQKMAYPAEITDPVARLQAHEIERENRENARMAKLRAAAQQREATIQAREQERLQDLQQRWARQHPNVNMPPIPDLSGVI